MSIDCWATRLDSLPSPTQFLPRSGPRSMGKVAHWPLIYLTVKITVAAFHNLTSSTNWLTMYILGLSRVTDYPWAVGFSVVTGYKFTNRLTGSCTDDLLETWSCQNHKKIEETLVNPSYIWAKMRLLSVFSPLTGPREPVNWHFLPLEVAWGQVPPGGGIEIWF